MVFEDVVSDGLRHKVRVVFESLEIENEVDRCVREKAKTFRMHGFRVGHVPLDIVKNSVGGSVVTSHSNGFNSNAGEGSTVITTATLFPGS